MLKNIFVVTLFFYFLVLLQTSFLVHFTAWGYVPNLILILVILLNIFSPDIKLGIMSSVLGGFFLDVFSGNFIGFWILILLAAALFIQFIIKKHIQLKLLH